MTRRAVVSGLGTLGRVSHTTTVRVGSVDWHIGVEMGAVEWFPTVDVLQKARLERRDCAVASESESNSHTTRTMEPEREKG